MLNQIKESLKQIDDHESFKKLLDQSIIYTMAIGTDGIIQFANSAELEYLGYEPEEFIGKRFLDFVFDTAEGQHLWEVLPTGEELNNDEFIVQCKNGELNNWLISSMTRSDASGKVLYYLFSRNITDFKRTQELLGYLNKAGEELASALDTDTALNKISSLLVPRFANWFAIDILKGDRIVGLKVKHDDPERVRWAEEYRNNNPTDISDTTSALVIVLTTRQPVLVPEITEDMFRASIKDPERLEMFLSMNLRSVIIAPMIVGEEVKGAVTFISTEPNRRYNDTDLKFAQDFANRVGLTLENARLYENANQEIQQRIAAEKKKDEFISIASHELKTPLTSIKAYIQLLQKTLDPTDRSYNFILKTNEHIARLERLIADLLDVSKIEAGQMSYRLEEFNFAELLQESVESSQNIASGHIIKVEQSVDAVVKADRLRIEQVLNNFISNAIKYSPGEKEVIIRAEIQQKNLVISVQDFGIGIERRNMGNLFERFYRVDNSSMKFQGLGLGLYISAEILKRHNGSFWIESNPGEGSKFFFLLPLADDDKNKADTDEESYYKDDLITIQVNKEKGWIEADWTGFQNLESVKNGCLEIHKLLKLNRCTKVLNDNTHVLGNWSEAVDWGQEVWFPMMEQAGTKHFAWIYSPSTFSQLSAEKSVELMQGDIKTRLFNNRDEAIAWLETV
ncbi:MAG: hypothetical protein K0S09_1813 [Sphingobacteriaceae bacterium]|jgi:PAS domain S-box-containing protein|nr:hypothetical protein [Sphingobacteriaceae bacterium]